jgi:hypothetical protein
MAVIIIITIIIVVIMTIIIAIIIIMIIIITIIIIIIIIKILTDPLRFDPRQVRRVPWAMEVHEIKFHYFTLDFTLGLYIQADEMRFSCKACAPRHEVKTLGAPNDSAGLAPAAGKHGLSYALGVSASDCTC